MFGFSGAGLAQDGPDGAVMLEEITVTARKRPENAQDIPMSLTVINREAVPSFSADPGADIARSTPNFNFTDFSVPGQNFSQMRGIAPLGSPFNSLDNTVGYSQDGVPTSAFGSFSSLLDVERVEVLRGPQGTLFGRNALGGAVNVISTPADGRREFTTSGEIGSDGHRVAQMVAGGWLVQDKIAGRLALRYSHVDGDIRNSVIGGREGGAELASGKTTLTFTPNDTLDVTVRGGFDRDHRDNPMLLLAEHPDFPRSGLDEHPSGKRDMENLGVEVNKSFDSFKFTSISSVQNIKIRQRFDDTDAFLFSRIYGGSVGDYNDTLNDKSRQVERERIYSQELRVSSLEGANISWVAGASYFRSEYDTVRDQTSTVSAYTNGINDTQIVSQTWAAFGDVSVPVTDRLTLSGGLRLANDDQKFTSLYVGNGNAPLLDPRAVDRFGQRRNYSDTYLTGRAAASWRWTDGVSTYASVAHGYVSGGFERYSIDAVFGIPTSPYRPSKGWTYEAGLKSRFLDDRVTLNAAAFYNDIKDGQLTTFDPLTFYVEYDNQDYKSYGFEVESTVKISDRLSARGGFGYTKSKIVNVGGNASALQSTFNGARVPNVPEYTANFAMTYVLPGEAVGVQGAFTATGEVQYMGSRQADTGNSYKLDPYTFLNAQLGWGDDKTKVYGFARNILDKRPQYFGSTYAPNTHGLIIGRGRLLGVGASYTW
ncbi:TonB-dependent receptor [Methylopila jiangsuensis]|uniref:TonB-dependent receptor n=2 Tax=Methylopila jiangsuensis TaxID=586230 RepID=A0A9W6JKL6_9HYPH|nr:TonB-dependent receptor [Methylopila jiangsuensis]